MKAPEILGVEIESDSPDLRGRIAEAEGILERDVVTQKDLDEEWQKGPFQNRGPGVFYRLRDPFSHQTAKVKPPGQPPEATPAAATPRAGQEAHRP